MSGYAFPLSLLQLMLEFGLAPLLPLVSCQEAFLRTSFSAGFWLVQADYFVVQSMHIHRFDCGFDQAMRLKFQMIRYIV